MKKKTKEEKEELAKRVNESKAARMRYLRSLRGHDKKHKTFKACIKV